MTTNARFPPLRSLMTGGGSSRRHLGGRENGTAPWQARYLGSPQRSPGAELLVRGSVGQSLLKLKHFWFWDVQWKPQIHSLFYNLESQKSQIFVFFAENRGWPRNCPRLGPKTATVNDIQMFIGISYCISTLLFTLILLMHFRLTDHHSFIVSVKKNSRWHIFAQYCLANQPWLCITDKVIIILDIRFVQGDAKQRAGPSFFGLRVLQPVRSVKFYNA